MKQVGFIAVKYDSIVSINNVFIEPDALQMMRQIKIFLLFDLMKNDAIRQAQFNCCLRLFSISFQISILQF